MSSCILCLSIMGINVEVSDHVNKSKEMEKRAFKMLLKKEASHCGML